MKPGLLTGALLLAIAAPASAMSVDTFLAKAQALKTKGPLALFSSDVKLLTNQVKGDAAAIRTERLAAEKAGKRVNHCPPAAGVKMTDRDVLVAMEGVPAAARPRTSTRDALRGYLARRFPCKA